MCPKTFPPPYMCHSLAFKAVGSLGKCTMRPWSGPHPTTTPTSPRSSLASLPLLQGSASAHCQPRHDGTWYFRVVLESAPSSPALPSTPPRPALAPPRYLPTELNLTLEDKLGFLFLTLFLWNTPSLCLPLPLLLLSLHYLFITLLTSWPLRLPLILIFFFVVLLNNYTLINKRKSTLRLAETLLTGLGLYCSFIDDSGCQSASLQRSPAWREPSWCRMLMSPKPSGWKMKKKKGWNAMRELTEWRDGGMGSGG